MYALNIYLSSLSWLWAGVRGIEYVLYNCLSSTFAHRAWRLISLVSRSACLCGLWVDSFCLHHNRLIFRRHVSLRCTVCVLKTSSVTDCFIASDQTTYSVDRKFWRYGFLLKPVARSQRKASVVPAPRWLRAWVEIRTFRTSCVMGHGPSPHSTPWPSTGS